MTSWPLNSKAQSSNQVLTKIEEHASRWRCDDRNRCDQFDSPHRRTNRRKQRTKIPINGVDSSPVAVIVKRLRPAIMLQAGIVDLTIINIAGKDWSGGGAPRLRVIRDNPLNRAIRVRNFQLSKQRQAIAVNIAVTTSEA